MREHREELEGVGRGEFHGFLRCLCSDKPIRHDYEAAEAAAAIREVADLLYKIRCLDVEGDIQGGDLSRHVVNDLIETIGVIAHGIELYARESSEIELEATKREIEAGRKMTAVNL